jgi:integrase
MQLPAANPCERGGRLYRGSRADRIWSAEDEAAFLERRPEHLKLPLLLALWTGQRQGDLLGLPWSAYDGAHIKLKQGKTGARVVIKVGAPLKAALDAAPKRTSSRTAKAQGCRRPRGLTFNDLPLQVEYSPTKFLQLEIGPTISYYNISGVPGLHDRNGSWAGTHYLPSGVT